MTRAAVHIYTCDRCGETILVENTAAQPFTRSPCGALDVPVGWQQVGPALLCDKHRVWLELMLNDGGEEVENLTQTADHQLCVHMAHDIVDALEKGIPDHDRATKPHELPRSADYREPKFMLQHGELTPITETKPKRRIQIKKD